MITPIGDIGATEILILGGIILVILGASKISYKGKTVFKINKKDKKIIMGSGFLGV